MERVRAGNHIISAFLAFALLLGGTASAQPGGVHAQAKVSASAGGFSGPLHAADFFGTSIARIGDLDGDNIPDLAVGAEEDDDGGTNAGAVWILFMNANGTVKARTKIGVGNGFAAGEIAAGDDFGSSVAGIGDVDGDNIPDLAIGARSGDAGALSAGAVWIVFLNANGTVKGKQVLNAAAGGFSAGDLNGLDEFGRSVALVGSLGGHQTIAVGASGADGQKGAVWILGLNANGTIATKTRIASASVGNGLDASDGFGSAIAGLGDINGNGVPDIAVGAMLDDDGGPGRGAVWILFLQANGTVAGFQKISGTAGGFGGTLADFDQFGRSLAAVGDLNCDGSTELAVGAYENDDAGPDRGAVWIVSLSSAGVVTAQQKISSTAGTFSGPLDNNDQFGTSIAALGDFDGDLIPDIAVGTPNDDDGFNNAGAVWLLFLKSTDTVPPSITCPGVGVTTSTDPNLCTAVVTFTVPATDNCPGVNVTCTPPSGFAFPKGTTSVNCVATDIANNTATCGFTVTVLDTQPPSITCPANIAVATAPNTCAATVTYAAPSVSDNCPGVGVPVCAPPSGSTFQKGVTPVSCTVSDASGNTATCSFSVTVRDTQPPSITCPANIARSTDPGLCSAIVVYPAPAVSDNCPGVQPPVCVPASGTVFPGGVTTVNCTVADAGGNTSSCAFTITVNDTELPQITAPGPLSLSTDFGVCGKYKANVNLGTPVVSDNCPGVTYTNNAPNLFPVGTTTVTWTAIDASGNTRSATQSVTITDNQPPSVSAYLTPSTLVPANQTMRSITAYLTVTDNCPGVTYTLYSLTSSDPDAGMFSGDLPNDIQGAGLNTPDTQFYLRAERGWSSRTYTVKYRAQDAHSNVTLNTRLVVVPVSSLTGGYVTKDPDTETRTPEQVTLDQNYPNPFNPMTVIRYSIPSDGRVRLAVYDLLARRVTTLVDEVQTAGAYLATFDGSMLPSGLYTYVLEANGSVLKKTMGLVK